MNIKLAYPFLIGLFFLFTSCAKKVVQVVEQPTQVKKPSLKVKLNSPKPSKKNTVSQLLLIDGLAAKESGDFEQAVNFFKGAIKIDSLNDAAHYQLGRVFLETSPPNQEQALHYYSKAFECDSKNQWYGSQYAKLLVDAGQTQNGIDVFKQLINENPKNLHYQYELAYSYEKAKQYDSAIKIYENIEDSRGFDPSINYQKHKIYFAQNKMELGIKEIEKIVEKDPKYTSYLQYLAKYFYDTGNQEKAKRYASLVLKNEPNDYVANSIMASLSLKEGNKEATKKYLNFIVENDKFEINQKIKAFLPIIGLLEKRSSMYAMVIQSAKKLISIYPKEAKGYALLGDLLANDNQTDEAIQAFKKSVEQEGAVYGVWEQLLLLLSSTKKYSELETVSKQAFDKFPDEFLAYYLNGFANRELKNYEKSLEALKNAERLSKSQPNLKTELTVLIAEAYYLNRQQQKGFELFENIYQKNPKDLLVLNNYSYYLAKSKTNFPKAENLIKSAIVLSPDDSNLLDTYGYVLFQKGKYDDAMKIFRQAFELEPTNSRILERLGDCQVKLGKRDMAVQLWKDALKLRSHDVEVLKKKISTKKYYQND